MLALLSFFSKGKQCASFIGNLLLENGPGWLQDLQGLVWNGDIGLLIPSVKNVKVTGEHETKCGPF